MKSFTRLALAAAFVAGTLSSALAADPETLRVTYVTAPFNVPSIVEKHEGILEADFGARGIKIERPEITSGAKQTEAIAAGAIDVASVLGGASAILAKANGVDVRIIAVYSRSPKAFALMTRADGPATLADLKGKKIAGPKGTTLHQLLAAALASTGLTINDVDYINMDLPAARAALISGDIDVATLAGNNAIAVEKAGGKTLVTGDGLIHPTTVIAASGTFIDAHPDLVDAYLAAHRTSLDFMAERPDEALKIAADEQKISIDDAKAQLPLYDFTPTLTDADIANLQADQTFMIDNGMLPKDRAIDIRKDLVAPVAFAAK
ncbi:ABC transporter substrate-binding protein [Pleomorphomonas carboxyditropha]|uniref:ABC transporter substrate-binding protein n=1 Tax=Pleomorphomonas carboxyditropha TaxID=2023338 RepID=A0A2G9WR90_9HYPH|nr:NrtA/SsuA/CpmA family ABC transporter substrate-binding protein [Pleomorphomonas carboxyditropha]PIO96660.1 ABC transporter substrate-binding protein [Pleomorphomonas carboxyditropha]